MSKNGKLSALMVLASKLDALGFEIVVNNRGSRPIGSTWPDDWHACIYGGSGNEHHHAYGPTPDAAIRGALREAGIKPEEASL